MASNRRHELGVGVLLLVSMGLLAWMALQVGALRGLGGSIDLTGRLPDAAGLTEGAVVKVAGVDMGRVTSLRIDEGVAVVSMQVRPAAGIRKDAVLSVRARSLLGEKYVAIDARGVDAPLATSGDELGVADTPVEMDQLVNQLGPLLGAVDADQLQETVAVFNKALADDPQRVERMVADLEVLLDNAATASHELPALMQETRQAVAEVRTLTRQAGPVLGRADRISTQLEDGTRDLAATRAELDALLAEARVMVQRGGEVAAVFGDNQDDLERILGNVAEIDKTELRRLLREEGILVRLKKGQVSPTD